MDGVFSLAKESWPSWDEYEEGMRSTSYRALEVVVWILDFIPRKNRGCKKITWMKNRLGGRGHKSECRRPEELLARSENLNQCRAV